MDGRREIMIRIDPLSCRVFLEQQKADSSIAHKEIEPIELYNVIKQNVVTDEAYHSGLLPVGCISISFNNNGYKRLYLLNKNRYADISFYETEYPHFPLPRLVFGVTLNLSGRASECTLGVVDDGPLTPDSPMYHYPFSNVNGFHLCTGQNSLPVYKNIYALKNYPDYILRMPNNLDYYSRKSNKMNMEYRDLLEHLKDKEPEYYYNNVLIPNGKTLSDFLKGVGK